MATQEIGVEMLLDGRSHTFEGFRRALHSSAKDEASWKEVAERHGLKATPPEHAPADYKKQLIDLASNLLIALEVVFSLECLLGCVLAVMYTLAYWKYGLHLAVNMSWNLVSLAVIIPISQGIGMGFKRREQALGEFGNLLAHLRSLWGALHSWKIKDGSEFKRVIDVYENPQLTEERIHVLFEKLFAAMIAYFDVERTGRARQAKHPSGKAEAAVLQTSMRNRRHFVGVCIARLQRLVQDLKAHGLPGGEAHRLDQYVSKSCIAFDRLTMLKEYRTPQAFRAFARIYILVIGAMYGPYYMYLFSGEDGDQRNLGLSIAFACAIQVAMSGLLNVMLGLEDPFDRSGKVFVRQLDSVKVAELLEAMRQQMVQIADDAGLPWDCESMDGAWNAPLG